MPTFGHDSHDHHADDAHGPVRAGSRSPGHDAERLDARLDQVGAGLAAVDADLARLHRLASVGIAAGMVAHELRNLLAPVRAYAQLGRRHPDDAAVVGKALAAAEDASDRAVRIAESILGLVAGARSDPHEPEAEALGGADVLGAVEGALASLVRDPARDGIEVRLEIEPGLRVPMGEVELRQVLANLCSNAVRAMAPHGGGVLTVRACRCSTWNTPGATPGSMNTTAGPGAGAGADGGGAMIEVADTGCGMEPEVLTRAFEPCFTASGGTASHGVRGGVGLGLAVCKLLVEGAGGRIEAVSKPGMGCRLRVVFGQPLV